MILLIQINLLLIVAYSLYKIVLTMESFFNYSSTAKYHLRCAQFLVVLSLLGPILIKSLPVKKLEVNKTNFTVFSDSPNVNVAAQSTINSMVKDAPEKMNALEQSISFDYKMILLIVWILGSISYVINFVKNYFNLSKLLDNSIVLKQNRKFKIVVSGEVLVPFSVKMFSHCWVVIPESLLAHKKDLSLAIKHELQHHRQGDTVWAIAIELVICCLFFNPIIYLWKNIIIEFQEFSCDEALTGQKDVLSHDYGSCLLRVAETALTNRQVYAGTTSMAVVFKNSKYFKTFLLRRIEMIVKKKKSTSRWIPICTGVMLTLFTLSFAYGVEKISKSRAKKANTGIAVVDKDVQKIADAALKKALKETNSVAGFVIVADPVTGKILAISNIDTKNLKKGQWALSQLIEPASFAKTLVIAEAIQNDVTTPDELHQCENGKYRFKDKFYYDWKQTGWQQLPTTQALAISSDICSLKIGEKVGEERIEKMIERFGLGEDGSSEDFPGASIGELPERGDHFIPQMTLGFDFKTSPIELMQAYGVIANGGNLMKPIQANSNQSKLIKRVLDVEVANKMKNMLQEVVLSGTGTQATSTFYTTAGKTASARLNEFMKIDWYGGDKHANFAGFIGFAPVEKPRVQVFVGLINPNTDKTGAHGGEHAAPVFKEVAENVLAFLKVAPDKL